MELSMEANTSASHDSLVMIPNKFYLPKTFLIFMCSFGLAFESKNEKVRGLILQAIIPYKN